MKILFLTNYASPYRIDFFNELGKSCELTVLFVDKVKDQQHRSQKWFQQQKYSHFTYVQLEKKFGFGSRRVYWDVLKYLNKNYDAIVVCGYSSPLTMGFAVEYLKLRNIPFYIEIDGGLIRHDSWLKYHLKRHLISTATYWLGSGKQASKYLLHYGAKQPHIYEYPFTSLSEADVLKQPVSQEQKQVLRRQLGITEPKVLISIGQFIPRKGYDLLLKAAANLSKDIGIYIIGSNPTPEYLDLQKQFGLTQVHFVGFQPKEALKQWYQAADVFVLPTREDIWGLVINEAMAQGLPVITTDRCVAGLELVKEGENGYIVPVENVPALTQAITRLFAQDYRAMGQKSLELIKPYTIENMAKRHLQIFSRSKGRR